MSKFGTFQITMTKEDADFAGLMYGKESASFLLGKSMKATFTDLGKGRVAAHWFSSDPALAKFNFFGVFYEGDGHTINMPGFGGLVKYSSQSTADGYKTTMDLKSTENSMLWKCTVVKELLKQLLTKEQLILNIGRESSMKTDGIECT